jgi:hypothetical protein|tara:strand:- start:397 stop:612 length:216 start_codon:yes stop_codon:yes gene_type:complete
MPKGKGYTAKQIMRMRDEGVFSPSEINALEIGQLDNSTKSSRLKTLRDSGVLSPSEIQAIEKRGYKYFPDN